MSDLISRQAAISAICNACGKIDCDQVDKCEKLQLPPANNSEIPNSSDTISRQAAIDCLCNGKCTEEGRWCDDGDCMPVRRINSLPPAEPEPYLDSIVSEIEKTISETRESGKHHDINVRTNGAMICFGLQLALEIIEEKRAERREE